MTFETKEDTGMYVNNGGTLINDTGIEPIGRQEGFYQEVIYKTNGQSRVQYKILVTDSIRESSIVESFRWSDSMGWLKITETKMKRNFCSWDYLSIDKKAYYDVIQEHLDIIDKMFH